MTEATTAPEVIFENEYLVAINKPHGLLVHKTRLAADADQFAVQLVRNYLGKRVYPAHRLDRKTSGVLLFTKSKEANAKFQQLFRERKVEKTYHAIVRGYIASFGEIDYPLTDENKIQEAQTSFKCLEHFEINIPSGNFKTSRYSYVQLNPNTGRHHQIRKHLAHIFHPIIGDRPHGCNKQNKIWKEKFNMTTMLLHASLLKLQLLDNQFIEIAAKPSTEFKRALELLRTNNCIDQQL